MINTTTLLQVRRQTLPLILLESFSRYFQYTTTTKASPLSQLCRLRTLIQQANATNSKLLKERILTDYADLHPLLTFIYKPHVRIHLTSTYLLRHLSLRVSDKSWQTISAPHLISPSNRAQLKTSRAASYDQHSTQVDPPETILELFEILSQRKVTGKKALVTVSAFLEKHGILRQHEEALDEKGDLLRNALLRPTALDLFCRCMDRNLKAGFSERILAAAFGEGERREKRFQVALGKTVERQELKHLFQGGKRWYASRKLDGVRCLVFVNLCQEKEGGITVNEIQTLSRTGREFSTLGLLKQSLCSYLPTNPAIHSLLSSGHRRLVFDGEVCALLDQHVEDFKGIVGVIMRKNHTIQNPAFFPFDLLTLDEFEHWGGRNFSERIELLQKVTGGPMRRLDQISATTIEEVQGILSESTTKGWEGLILRQDVPYQGKRTPSLRKYKAWQDAEYQVVSLSLSDMRLSHSGVYTNTPALSAVQIKHKGTLVSVGSGFTTPQRIEFAKHPERIVGKWVTVQYFEECENEEREGKSLRFPRIKTVWEKERNL